MRQQIDQKINEANHKNSEKEAYRLIYELAKGKFCFFFLKERQHKEIKCYLFEGISVLSYFTIYCLT